MDNNRKKYIISLLVIACIMTIGFAVLSTTLTLSSTTTVNANTWDVKFQNIVEDSTKTVSGSPVISGNTSLNFSITLNNPGDKYAFSVDVVNTGSIDAMVNSITKTSLTTAQKKLISFDVFYSDGSDILKYDKLNKTNGTDTIIVLVEYKVNVDSDDLPTSAINLNLGFSINYVQADSNAKLKESQYLYAVSLTYQVLGQAMPSITTYTTPNAAMTAFEGNVFNKHKITSGVVESSYLGMKLNDKIYYVKTDTDGTNFYRNKYILSKIFNISNYECNYLVEDTLVEFGCQSTIDDLPMYGAVASIMDDNQLYYTDEEGQTYLCGFMTSGASGCGAM